MTESSGLPALAQWRDFFALIGSAAGAIVGATFVVATLTSSLEKRNLGLRGFVTPTAVHLGSVVVAAAFLTVPTLTSGALAAFTGIGGLAGAVYGVLVVARIWRHKLDLSDRAFYIFLPIAAYLAMLAAAFMVSQTEITPALNVLAGSLLVLLVIGMRNAWDMATFIILGGPSN